VQLISRLIDGQYPDYQQIIPKDFSTQILLEKEQLVNVIKIAGLFSTRVNDVKFFFQKNRLDILSADPDLGENKSQIDAEIKGKEITASFNYRYLLEGLSNIAAKRVFMGLNSDAAPAVIRSQDEDGFTCLIMPIKNN
jgi:DNA polymerase-3 subunit beta